MDKLYVVIPAYNEELNIEAVVDDWHKVVEKTGRESRLVVVDDGSKDSTYKILHNIMDKYPQLIALTKANQGHGATVLYGYRYAVKAGADYVFQTDSDGQTNPEEFEAFWQLRDKYDAIIGNRNNRRDGVGRKFVSLVLRVIIHIIFGVNVQDVNTPFRLMKVDTLNEYMKVMPQDYNLPNIILTAMYAQNSETLKFIDITFEQRKQGKNSINIRKIVKIGLKAITDFKLIKKNMYV